MSALENRQTFVQRMLFQGFVILVLAAMLALTVNQFRGERLPWVGDFSASDGGDAAHDDGTTISLAEARTLFDADQVQFVDARSMDDFEAGHIRGALNLPWLEFDAHIEAVLPELRDDVTIVTYCDGEACHLSKDLARSLKDMGFVKVKVLVNGWSIWRDAGLPTAEGAS